jgi:hypothetical protein
VCRLVTTLGTHGLNNWKDKALVWTSISASAVEYFLKEIDLPQNEFMKIGENGESLVEAYIQDRARTELKVWDVAFPYITQGKGCEFPFAYLANSQSAKYLRSRTSGIRENSELVKITANNAVAFGADDLAYGEDREAIERKVEAARAHAVVQNNKEPSVNWLFASSRTRPLLVVHLLNFALKDSEEMNEPLKISDIHPAVSISMVFPSTGMVCKERRYKASPRLIQMLNEQRKESESDGEIEDE